MSFFLKIIPDRLAKKISAQSENSKVFLFNASLSFVIKGINIFVSFITVPLVLSFLSTTQYGIWLTLMAIISWFALFDLGFGNGLRNKLTLSVTSKNTTEGKIYVSTTYAALSVIFGTLLFIFLIANQFINWAKIFNAPDNLSRDLSLAVLYAVSFLFVQFILRLINTILYSFQLSAFADLTGTIVQVSILIGLYLLKTFHYNTLSSVALVYSVIPVFVFTVVSLILYMGRYKIIRPSFKFIRLDHIKGLLNLGLSFFVIQIAALVLYASDNFIITQFFKPADVTVYNIAFKYFSITNMVFTIILTPFWSMTTKAFSEGDYNWISKAVKKLFITWGILIICELVQLAISKPLFKVWTHDKVVVPIALCITMSIYFVIMNWGVVFGNFLNGVGKIRLQLYFSVVGMIVNIPLAIVLIKSFNMGIIAVPVSTIIVMVGGNILASIQYKKIISNRAVGIWDK